MKLYFLYKIMNKIIFKINLILYPLSTLVGVYLNDYTSSSLGFIFRLVKMFIIPIFIPYTLEKDRYIFYRESNFSRKLHS